MGILCVKNLFAAKGANHREHRGARGKGKLTTKGGFVFAPFVPSLDLRISRLAFLCVNQRPK